MNTMAGPAPTLFISPFSGRFARRCKKSWPAHVERPENGAIYPVQSLVLILVTSPVDLAWSLTCHSVLARAVYISPTVPSLSISLRKRRSKWADEG